MRGRVRLTLLFSLVALLVAGMALPAEATKRKVPFGFFGTTVPHPMADPNRVSDATLDAQVALMARSGVESARSTFAWQDLEPLPGAYNLAATDRLVAASARHGLRALLNVTGTPRWASDQPDADWWRVPPSDPNRYGELMRQLVLRYGTNGSFWAQNPGVPKKPVRRWQVWNEQSAPWHWSPRPWGPSYTQLLKAAYGAIHGADPGAKVVAGSLVAFGNDYAPWDAIRELYNAGGKPYFDAVAVHPFTNDPRSVKRTVDQTVEIVRRVRAQMRRRGDKRKPIILTEMTWPAAKGEIPKGALLGLSTSSRGQAARLEGAYRKLARVRKKLRVTEVYWYAWATEYSKIGADSVLAFRYSGLVRWTGGPFSKMPILKTYARVAASYEGCRKGANARRCRG